MTENNACLACGAQMKMKLETVKHDEGGLNITLAKVPVYRCPKCGEFEVAIRNIGRLHMEIAHSLARRKPRLKPAEIRFMRKYLGLSVEDLADRLHADVGTVKHWEASGKPRKMGAQSEVLLRMMVLLNQDIEGYDLKGMASSDAEPKPLRAEPDNGAWRVMAA